MKKPGKIITNNNMRNIGASTIILLCLVNNITSSQILGIFPSPGYSQFILAEKLMVGLVTRGHEVTVISPFSPKKHLKNYRTISTASLLETIPTENLFDLVFQSKFEAIYDLYDFGFSVTEETLSAPHVEEFLKSNNSFDLVIVEHFLNEAHMGFAHQFKAPLVIFSSIGANQWTNNLVGNPAPPSYVPNVLSGYSSQMTFLQSVKNSLLYLYDLLVKNFVVLPAHNRMLHKYFPDAPDLKDLIANISLVLLNSHPAVTEPLPLVPNMIEIGGFHIANEPLPQDLHQYLDDAKDGVIYFSMGSNLKSIDLSDDLKKDILKVFSKLNQSVLWKFEDDGLSNKPSNVKIDKWLPQSSILAHPNLKAFITHCGLLSSLETVYFGVPVLCIPIFFDQEMNAAVLERKGLAVRLDFLELSEDTLSSALDRVLHDKYIKENIKKNSDIMKDSLVDPLQEAIYWIEFVIKYKGAPHLKCPSHEVGWIRYFFINFIVPFVLSGYSCICLLKRLTKKFSSGTKKQKQS